jgi:molecular chaperone GrpE
MSDVKTGDGAAADAAAPAGAEPEVLRGEVVEDDGDAPGAVDAAAPEDAGAGVAEDAAGAVEADIDALLADARRERDEYLDLAQRTRADFDNFRKRAAGEASAARVRGRAELASDLVSVIDNLERALETASVDPRAALAGEVSAEGPLEQGIVLTYRELHGALQRAGVESFDPVGEPFDPTWHEALQTRAEEGTASGVVLDVMQKGYRIGEQLIRAARVVVSE